MKENQHVLAIPAEVLTQAQTKTDELKTLLAPYMLALTLAEWHELPKIDFGDAHGLWMLLNTVQQIHQNIDDMEMAAGSEAYTKPFSCFTVRSKWRQHRTCRE